MLAKITDRKQSGTAFRRKTSARQVRLEKRKRNRKIVTIVIFAAVGLAVVCGAALFVWDSQFMPTHKAAYLSDKGYAKALGISKLSYDPFRRKYDYGLPQSSESWIKTEYPYPKMLKCVYPGFEALFTVSDNTSGEETPHMVLLTVTSENVRFGRMKIGIGSSYEDVQEAYAKDQKIDAEELAYSALDYPDVDEGFYGEDWCSILFRYDENGNVESMAYEPPAN